MNHWFSPTLAENCKASGRQGQDSAMDTGHSNPA